MEKININNNLYSMRYSITQAINATYGEVAISTAMALTYKKLIEAHKSNLATKSPGSSQSFRNHLSTLNSFMAYVGKDENSFVGKELRVDFETTVTRFSKDTAKNKKSFSDKRGHLRAIKNSLAALENPALPKEFTGELRKAVARSATPPKTLAKRIGMSTSAIQRWMAGALPNTKTLPSLRRLERELGIERHGLERFLNNPRASKAAEIAPPPINEFRQRMKSLTALPFRLRPEAFGVQLTQEWTDFLAYKTAPYSPFARRDNAKWRLLPLDEVHGKVPQLAQVDGLACPSAQLALSKITAYLGFLRLERAKGGLGLPDIHCLSMAALVVPEWLTSYMEFMKRRAAGKIHEGHATFAALISSLAALECGYMFQREDLITRLPEYAIRGRTWNSLCSEATRLARAWKSSAKDTSRDPSVPIQPLLNLEEPLGPVLRAIRTIDSAAANAPPNGVQQACHKRDALLLSFVLHVPLRLRTLALITYGGNEGNIYRRGNEWRLRLKGDNFKNDSGARTDDFDVSLEGINDRLEEYLGDFHPTLVQLHPSCNLLFPSIRGPSGKHSNLGRHIQKLTEKYIPECAGFGPHAIRHLVPSAYLKAHPKDYLTVAELLHDNLTTVMKRYAHLSKDDSLKRYSAHLAQIKA